MSSKALTLLMGPRPTTPPRFRLLPGQREGGNGVAFLPSSHLEASTTAALEFMYRSIHHLSPPPAVEPLSPSKSQLKKQVRRLERGSECTGAHFTSREEEGKGGGVTSNEQCREES